MLNTNFPATPSVLGKVLRMSFSPCQVSIDAILNQAESGPDKSPCFLMALSITPSPTTLNCASVRLDASHYAKLRKNKNFFAICEAKQQKKYDTKKIRNLRILITAFAPHIRHSKRLKENLRMASRQFHCTARAVLSSSDVIRWTLSQISAIFSNASGLRPEIEHSFCANSISTECSRRVRTESSVWKQSFTRNSTRSATKDCPPNAKKSS